MEAAGRLDDKHLLTRAYARAGQSAHFQSRDQDGLAYHRGAQSVARLKSDKREALWGEFVCSIERDDTDCETVLNHLEGLGS